MACLGGFEHLAFGVGVQRSIQLSYGHMYFVVNFSPAANGVGVQRSIQLSYRHTLLIDSVFRCPSTRIAVIVGVQRSIQLSYRHTLLFFFGTFGGNFP